MNDKDIRGDRHALLELDALLARIQTVAAGGDRDKFETDDPFRWVLHRLWIAVGNEALAYARLTAADPRWRPRRGILLEELDRSRPSGAELDRAVDHGGRRARQSRPRLPEDTTADTPGLCAP